MPSSCIHPLRGEASAERFFSLWNGLAAQAGFRSLEMGATVTGAPLYAQEGYRKVKRMTIALHVLTGLSLSGQVQGLAPGV